MWIFSPFHGVVVLALLYFIPAIVGGKKRNARAIFWLNFFLGWTVVGWVGTLVWALMQDPLPAQVIVNQLPPASIFCAACEKYSPPGARFCRMCGAQITT
jgi:hypothetical protein